MSTFGNQPQWDAPRPQYAQGGPEAAGPPPQPSGSQWAGQQQPPPPQGPWAPQGAPAQGSWAPQGAPVPQGPQGPAGPAGPAGPRHARQAQGAGPAQHQWAAPQEPYQAPWGLTAATGADAGRREARSAATKQMVIGGVVALIGILITVGTYAAASDDGGHYFVAYGPAIIGVITFVKGLVGYLRA